MLLLELTSAWLGGALLFALPAFGAPSSGDDEYILDGDGEGQSTGPHVTQFRTRLSVYSQDGRGYQAVDWGTAGGKGRESAVIVQPAILAEVQQSASITHQLVVTADVVSAASPSSVDILSSASAVNSAGSVSLESSFDLGHRDQLRTVVGVGAEEILQSGTVGLGYVRSLADDNATLSGTFRTTFDSLARYDLDGFEVERGSRLGLSLYLEATQLLSPTTVLSVGYGATRQSGDLETPSNRVPFGERFVREELPESRWRHAARAAISQYLLGTHTTLDAQYRYYFDTFGIRAHSTELWVGQPVTEWLVLAPSFRFHHQSGADFFTSNAEVPGTFEDDLRTADSDLDRFSALRYGLTLDLIANRENHVEASYFYYHRTNDLRLSLLSLSYGYSY